MPRARKDRNTDNRGAKSILGRRVVLVVVLAWVAMLGFDFFLHAGLLAGLYVDPTPFLLAPMESFRRIPIGYLSFLLLAILLVWLMVRMRLRGWTAGFGFGLKLGALIWGATTLGLFSISTADTTLLAGWFFGQTAELAVAGAVAGSGLAGRHAGGLALKVIALVLLLGIVTVALQAFGLAPAAVMPGVAP